MKTTRESAAVMTLGIAAGIGCLIAAMACGTQAQRGDRLLQSERIDDAVEVLESASRAEPANEENHLVRGSAHFRKAQRLLEAGADAAYVESIKRAQGAWLRALKLNPKSHHAHNQLGILATYRGDLEAARKSFEIARQLQPNGFEFYINLAEIAVYRGNLRTAERYLGAARKLGAPAGAVEMVEVLAAWRRGDLVEARDIFEGVRVIDPEAVRTWNGGTAIASFRDMAEHCCRLQFCGPYMEQACRGSKLPVIETPKRGVEIVTEEAQLEAERQNAVREIYEGRRDLEVQVDASEEDSLRAIEVIVEDDAPDSPRPAGDAPTNDATKPSGDGPRD